MMNIVVVLIAQRHIVAFEQFLPQRPLTIRDRGWTIKSVVYTSVHCCLSVSWHKNEQPEGRPKEYLKRIF